MRTIFRLNLLFLLLSGSFIAKSQPLNFYLGGEVGLSHSIAFNEDTGNSVANKILTNPPTYGAYVGLLYKRKIWGEIGAYAHKLGYLGVCFDDKCGVSNFQNMLELSSRYGVNINLHKRKWLFSPTLGYRIGFNNRENKWYSFETDTTGMYKSPYYKGEENTGLHKVYHLLETGLQFSYQDPKGYRASIFGRYLHGFQRIWENRFYYEYDDGTSGNAVTWQSGGYWMIGVSLNYTFGLNNPKA